MIEMIDKLLNANQELKKALEKLIENEDYRILLYSLSKTAPVMQWAKDTSGVYTFANDALAKHLFDSESGEDLIGKNDAEIVGEIIEKYPNWTFGTICVGTDQLTLEKQETLKFFEWGIVKDKFQYVVAYKSPYYDKNGNLLGTTGIAIYVTDEVEALIDILKTTKDKSTKEKLKKYLHRYGFEQEVFSNQNIDNVWK
jgi:PAS domain-containing protein